MSRLKIEKEFNRLLKNIWAKVKWILLLFVYPKWKLISISLIIILSLVINLGSIYIENYFKENYLDVPKLKNSILGFVNNNLKRAIIVGVADFSLTNGISFEDVRISEEEDFSNNKIIFFTKRIDFKIDLLNPKEKKIEKVIIHNAIVKINLDDTISEIFWDKLTKTSLPKIYFKNLKLIISKGGVDLFESIRPLNVIIGQENKVLKAEFDDAVFYNPYKSKISGEGTFKGNNKKNELKVVFDEYELSALEGIIEKLIYIKPQEGIVNGKIIFTETSKGTGLEGNLSIKQLKGQLGIHPKINVKNLSLKTGFNYQNKNEKKDSVIERFVKGPNVSVKDITSISEDNLKDYSLDLEVKNLEKFLEHSNLKKYIDIKGNVKLKANIKETGNEDNWFSINGNTSLENFYFYNYENPKLKIKLNNLDLNINNGNIHTRFSGKMFDKPFFSGINMKLSFSKSVQYDNFNFYPLETKIVHNLSIEDIVIQDYYPLYKIGENYIKASIKERQEKMLPETFFINSIVYKKYLENFHINSKININNLKVKKNSVNLGKYEILLKNEVDNSIKLVVQGNDEKLNNQNNSLNAQIHYHNQLPYINLNIATNSLLWFDKTIEICGNTFYTDTIDANITWQGSGNNFSRYFDTQTLASQISFKTNKIRQTNFAKNIKLSKYSNGAVFDIRMDIHGYGRTISINPIYITGNQLNFQGNGEYELDKLYFYLKGNVGKKDYSFSLIEDSENCFLK